ncbi:uncharacterized protein LOC129223543 [Uloborus diversus]|uniref:uncharacterized protein LOC129223543 n=1 Tax=Uloborus diversus TaxID=327109 RepID=UPI00240A614D|nr:uncharacterized protein LOC129223543 [Uloborus diversus]
MSCQYEGSLQSVCVKVIAHNFDRFFKTFECTRNKEFKLASEIIQKLYGNDLTKKLYLEGNIKNEHLDYLINRYTKDLDVQCFVNCESNDIEERIQQIGNVITKFTMTRTRHFDVNNFLRPLCKVQSLILSDTNCSDKSLMTIADVCVDLKELDLYNCEKVSDKGLIYLSDKKPALEFLDVYETSVTYKGVALILKNISTISELKFNNVPRAIFEATGLHTTLEESEERTFNLRNLVILNNPMRPESHLTAILKVCSTFCPYVNDLTVTEIINEEQLYLCSTFVELKTTRLSLSSVVQPKLSINELLERRGSQITSLSLTSFALSVDVLAESCPNLQYISLSSPSFEDTHSSTINFPCLKILHFRHSVLKSVDGNNLYENIISCSPNLEELHIVSSESLESLTDVILGYPEKLRVLNFSNTIVDIDFIQKVIKKHEKLSTLNIDNSGVSCADYDDLMDMVDDMGRSIRIVWADYSSAIRELYSTDFGLVFQRLHRHVLKL